MDDEGDADRTAAAVKITGAKAHAARLNAISGPAMERAVGRVLYVAGSQIAVAAQTLITAGSVSGKGHVVSLPGQAPNADTRVLDTHIIVDQVSPLRVRIISQAPYSAALEYGTSKMAARPFMRPALIKTRPAIVALVRRAVQQVIASSRVGVAASG